MEVELLQFLPLRGEDLFFVLSDNEQQITGPYYALLLQHKKTRSKPTWRRTLYALGLKKRPRGHDCGSDRIPIKRQQ